MRAPLRPAANHCAPASAASPLVPPPSGLPPPWLTPCKRRRRVLWYHSNDRDDDVEADAFRGRRRPPLRPQQPQPQLSVQQSYFAVHNDSFWEEFVWWHNWHIFTNYVQIMSFQQGIKWRIYCRISIFVIVMFFEIWGTFKVLHIHVP